MKTPQTILLPAALVALAIGICAAQNFRGGRGLGGGGYFGGGYGMDGPIVETEGHDRVDERTVQTAREIAEHSGETPDWTNAPGFERDGFTFARIIYKFAQYGSSPRVSRTASPWGWITDFPDSDLNLSLRLRQMTSVAVDPNGRVLKLTDPALTDYPFIYMVEPGRLELREEEVPILRRYLLNGGVLMVDDFWGQKQWDNFEYWMGQVLPGRSWTELETNHPIFHCVFDIKVPLNELQTPAMPYGVESLNPYSYRHGKTWEDHDDYTPNGTHDMHVRSWFDDKGRIMVIATHNCDNGDAWEREGANEGFFHEFSEKRGFPLGINIIYYLMTH